MNLSFEQNVPYYSGKAGLIIGICEQMGLGKVFDELFTSHNGRVDLLKYNMASYSNDIGSDDL